MFKTNSSDLSRIVIAAGLSMLLAACGDSNESFTSDNNNGGGGGAPPGEPQGVQVVAGDGDSTEVQNTISWVLDPDATDYTVFWDNAPGVTENSSEVVPTAQGLRHIVHSGVDVLAGNNYYYRVRASSADGSSALSAEVAGTPQLAITGNQLNDVAWNGTDTLVAVGDSGVILASASGTLDPWVDTSVANVPQPLAGVTWESVNSQFLIVGAASTVLTGDGTNWVQEDLGNLAGAYNLRDVAWVDDRYVAVGTNGTILTSNIDGSTWSLQDPGAGLGVTTLNGVASSADRVVVVGTGGTVLLSLDLVNWQAIDLALNNDLNDVTWTGTLFVAVGSNDTILTSPDGADWTSHVPGTADINFVAVTQWDSGLPLNPIVAAVGSAGTFVVTPDAEPGTIIRTGTTEQLGGLTWVDDGVSPARFMMVGHDGTVLTAQYP